jgi:hypothetical protein
MAGRENKERQVRAVLVQFAEDFKAVEIGQSDVQDHDVGWSAVYLSQCSGPTLRSSRRSRGWSG